MAQRHVQQFSHDMLQVASAATSLNPKVRITGSRAELNYPDEANMWAVLPNPANTSLEGSKGTDSLSPSRKVEELNLSGLLQPPLVSNQAHYRSVNLP